MKVGGMVQSRVPLLPSLAFNCSTIHPAVSDSSQARLPTLITAIHPFLQANYQRT
jgi:hypothetical protein